jgi:hypothetical protein
LPAPAPAVARPYQRGGILVDQAQRFVVIDEGEEAFGRV